MPFNFNQFVGMRYDQADCYQLVGIVCHALNRDVPCLSSADLEPVLSKWHRVDTMEAGDVITFGRDGVVSHCGIAVNTKKFLHADENCGAIITDLNDGYWNLKVEGIYRYA